MLAGEDTTAHSLARTLLYPAADHQPQQQMHEAALKQLGDAPVCHDYDRLRELATVKAMATEAIRPKPVVPLVVLAASRDLLVGDGAVPAGTQLFALFRPAQTATANFTQADALRPRTLGT